MYKKLPKKRYEYTLVILKKYAPQGATILDVGMVNPFSGLTQAEGYTVRSTQGEDLDFQAEYLQSLPADFATALGTLEHLISPLAVLQQLPIDKLLVTMPLRLWFARAYRNTNDPRDCRHHKFEDWQLDMLSEEAGWHIVYREKWTHPVSKWGIRPLLRLSTPRYYAIYAVRGQLNALGNLN